MRVLAFFLNDYDYRYYLRGGASRFFQDSKYLKKLGVDFHVLEYASSHSSVFKPLGYNPINIRINLRNAVLNAIMAILYGFIFCIKQRCELIYSPGRLMWGGGKWTGVIAPYFVSLILRKPMIVLFHHLQPWDFREKNPLTISAYRHSNIFAVSKSTAADIYDAFRLSEVSIIGNGIEIKRYSDGFSSKKEYQGVFLGRVDEAKGVFTLLKAWEKVVEQVSDAKLLFIGPIREGFEGPFLGMIQDLDLVENVDFTGYVSEDEKIRLLKVSEIFVFPSTVEGFGLSVIEAMASGLPSIISDIPALREIYSGAAILVPPKNIEKWSEKILSLLTNKLKRDDLIENGLRLVNNYSWEKIALNEYNIMRGILENG